MRRLLSGSLIAAVAAIAVAACGGSPPITPSPNPGGGGGVTPPPNAPPQVKSITPSATRGEVGVPITLTAAVEDADTPVANLTYAWTADTGTFSGTGGVVTWVAGQDAVTPADVVLTLTVTERYTSGSISVENKATGTTTVHVNNSPKELAELSLRFLTDFANSRVPPEKCVAEFSDTCAGGKKDEFNDIADNRHDFEILASSLRPTGVDVASDRLTATVHTSCSFTSKVITTEPREEFCQKPGACPLNSVGKSEGDCWTKNVYEKGRWWLCESHFTSFTTLTDFTRAFFGIRSPE